jgi:hypothetical protein
MDSGLRRNCGMAFPGGRLAISRLRPPEGCREQKFDSLSLSLSRRERGRSSQLLRYPNTASLLAPSPSGRGNVQVSYCAIRTPPHFLPPLPPGEGWGEGIQNCLPNCRSTPLSLSLSRREREPQSSLPQTRWSQGGSGFWLRWFSPTAANRELSPLLQASGQGWPVGAATGRDSSRRWAPFAASYRASVMFLMVSSWCRGKHRFNQRFPWLVTL